MAAVADGAQVRGGGTNSPFALACVPALKRRSPTPPRGRGDAQRVVHFAPDIAYDFTLEDVNLDASGNVKAPDGAVTKPLGAFAQANAWRHLNHRSKGESKKEYRTRMAAALKTGSTRAPGLPPKSKGSKGKGRDKK